MWQTKFALKLSGCHIWFGGRGELISLCLTRERGGLTVLKVTIMYICLYYFCSLAAVQAGKTGLDSSDNF